MNKGSLMPITYPQICFHCNSILITFATELFLIIFENWLSCTPEHEHDVKYIVHLVMHVWTPPQRFWERTAIARWSITATRCDGYPAVCYDVWSKQNHNANDDPNRSCVTLSTYRTRATYHPVFTLYQSGAFRETIPNGKCTESATFDCIIFGRLFGTRDLVRNLHHQQQTTMLLYIKLRNRVDMLRLVVLCIAYSSV